MVSEPKIRVVDGTDVALAGMTAMFPSADIAELRAQLEAEVNKLEAGDTSNLDNMLLRQALLLQAVFTELLVTARKADADRSTQIYAVALKAQAAARSTIEAIQNARKPRHVAYIHQANVAHNQQINNNGHSSPVLDVGVSDAPIELVDPLPNGGKKVDARAARATREKSQRLGALGSIDGA